MVVPVGVFVPQGWRLDLVEIDDPVKQYEAMTGVATRAESLGFDSVWLYDHFYTVPSIEQETTFEAWISTAGLCRDTSRIKVGQMVTCNGYRNPALLAKMASTVDVLSHGRLICGLGAGWYEAEWRGYGYGFPELKDRMGAFREATEIIHRMWTEDNPKFDGKYYQIDGPVNMPKGAHQPHPRLWLGGSGEKVTLRLVAKWADGCNIGGDIDTLKHKFEVLKRHCDAVRRNYDEITRSSTSMVHLIGDGEDPEAATAKARGKLSLHSYQRERMVGTANEIAEQLRARIAAGVTYIIVYLPRLAYDHEQLERFAGEVVPQLQ